MSGALHHSNGSFGFEVVVVGGEEGEGMGGKKGRKR
jgi:hypothetical protein